MKFIQRFGAILLIIAATFVVYAPALRNGFVWDDTALVLRDPLIRSWRLIPEGFHHFLFLDATGSNFYRPLQRLTFTADYAAWGFANPAGWHFTSMAIHAAAALAIYALLRRWFGDERRGWALGAALAWTLHPLHTSAVTYVAGRADPLAALGGFLGLGLAWRSLDGGPRAGLRQIAAALCFLGAMLSKESGAMFLVLCLALLVWRRIPRAAWLRWAVLLAAVLAIYLELRFTAEKTPPPPARSAVTANRSVLAVRAVAEYAGLIVAPVSLQMERDVTTRAKDTPEASSHEARWRTYQTFVGIGLVLGLIAWFWWSRRHVPDAAFALVAAFIAYFPISNIIPLNATVAEHWLYVPSAFLFAAVALTLARLALPRAVMGSVFAIWLGAMALRTWLRQSDWRDQRTFLTRTIEAGGDSARMHVNLGNLELGEGHLDTALAEYTEALRRDPELSFAHLAVATAELKLGHFTAARTALDRAAGTPGLEAEKMRLRTALDYAEKQSDPVPGYRAAAKLAPLNWSFRQRYFTALAQTGHVPQAISELRAFLEAQDFRAESWQLLSELLAEASQIPLAAAAHEEARRRDVRLP